MWFLWEPRLVRLLGASSTICGASGEYLRERGKVLIKPYNLPPKARALIRKRALED